ncbi:MAG: serine hydrolase [Thermoflexaceae bacterium]|nr:serine hydrolase [Thermoflexaceae bacterium]
MEESARHLPVLLVLLVAVFASAIGAANLTTGDGFNVTFVPRPSRHGHAPTTPPLSPLLHLVGAANVDATLRRIGAADLSVNTRDLPATAAGMARLMEAIVRGENLSPDARRHARDLLLAQEWREGIPAGLPPGATAGNKTGTWEGLTHDIGFVEAPGGTYVIAVLSAHGWVWDPIARISAAAWNELAR